MKAGGGTALVLGASAGVGRALAEVLAARGYALVLAARDTRDLEALCADLQARHDVEVSVCRIDLLDSNQALDAWAMDCLDNHPAIDSVLVTAGVVSAADDEILPAAAVDSIVGPNFLSVIKVSNRFLEHFEKRGSGNLVLFSSIAAAAPRRRNAVYAAAKAGLQSYGRSLQHRYAGTSIHVQIFALGYVDTGMSRGQQLRLPVAQPRAVAEHVVARLGSGYRFGYFPRWWGPAICLLGCTPWPIYRRLAF